jgi:hypothetical protein
MSDRPDVDTLAETARTYLLKQKCSQEHHDALAALSDLEARARNGEELAEAWTHGSTADVLTERLKAAEADRDAALDREAGTQDALDDMRRRVTALEAALREARQLCLDGKCSLARFVMREALDGIVRAGDGGGAADIEAAIGVCICTQSKGFRADCPTHGAGDGGGA